MTDKQGQPKQPKGRPPTGYERTPATFEEVLKAVVTPVKGSPPKGADAVPDDDR